MFFLHWGSFYHATTPVTWVSWCHPHLKWLSDKPPSSSLSMRWFLVSVLNAVYNLQSDTKSKINSLKGCYSLKYWSLSQHLRRNKRIVLCVYANAYQPTSILYRPQRTPSSEVSSPKLQYKRFVLNSILTSRFLTTTEHITIAVLYRNLPEERSFIL